MLRTYLKYLPPWQQFLLLLGLCLGIGLVGTLFSELFISRYSGHSREALVNVLQGKEKDVLQYRTHLILSQVAGVLFLFIIPAFVFAYLADPYPSHFLNTAKAPKKEFVGYMLLLFVIGLIATGVLGILNQYIPLPKSWIASEKRLEPVMEVLTNAPNTVELLVNIVVIAFFAAVSEELIFRGVLQRIMIHWCGKPWLGILITSILFSAFHNQFSGFLPRLGLGLILGGLYWYSRSIYIPILYHFIHNTFGVILAKYKPDTVNNVDYFKNEGVYILIMQIFIGLFAIMGVIYIFAILHKKYKINFKEIYPPKPDFFAEEKNNPLL